MLMISLTILNKLYLERMSSSDKYPINEWSLSDRPREKLMHNGKETLSEAELLAIIIGSGSLSKSAVELCKEILQDVNYQLNRLSRLDINDLMQYKGIGEAKAIGIVAALELGRRKQREAAELNDQFTCSEDIFKYMHPILGDLNHEVFYVLLLNRRNGVMKSIKVSSGGVAGTVVDQRLIFKAAIQSLASSIVVVHNHPSGNLTPSRQDLAITEKLSQSGRILDIQLLDHLIITQSGYYSFADEGKL